MRVRREKGGGGRTRPELGNDAVYKLSFDGVDYKIRRASDGGCNQREKKKRWKGNGSQIAVDIYLPARKVAAGK